jgi:hydrogenase maturation protease
VILIVAYGNSLRRDDGGGLILAEKMELQLRGRGLAVECVGVHQLTPELSEDIADERVSTVVFVDTRVATPGEGPAAVEVSSVGQAESSVPVGHHLDASVLMLYVRLLYKREMPAWLVTVPGYDFSHGEGLSAPTREAIAAFLHPPGSLNFIAKV